MEIKNNSNYPNTPIRQAFFTGNTLLNSQKKLYFFKKKKDIQVFLGFIFVLMPSPLQQ